MTKNEFIIASALSQGIKNGIMQHYFNLQSDKENPTLASPDTVEAISMISFNLGVLASTKFESQSAWEQIAQYASLMATPPTLPTQGTSDE